MTVSCWACTRPATCYCPTDDDGCGCPTCDLCDCACLGGAIWTDPDTIARRARRAPTSDSVPTWPSAERAARHARAMAGAAALTADDRRWLTDTAGARTTCDRRTPTGRCLLPLFHHGDHHADDTRSDPCA